MSNQSQMPWNYDVLNIIAIASYLLSIQNLQLNEKDLSNNKLNEHLQEQDAILHEQNEKYLNKIIKQNGEIIELLKGGRQ